MKDTAVIIPAYNEEAVIEDNINKIKKLFSTVIVVDDCSDDNTFNILQKIQNIHTFQNIMNVGAGATTQTGIEYALTLPEIKYFATIDADGQHEPKDLVEMRKKIMSDKLDIVIGSRFLGRIENVGTLKKIILKFAIKYANAFTKSNFTDTHNGIRIFNKKTAKLLNITEPRYAFCSEIINRIVENKLKIAEFPVTVKYTKHSISKGQSNINGINIAINMIREKLL